MRFKQLAIALYSAGFVIVFVTSWTKSSSCAELGVRSSVWSIFGGDGDCQVPDNNSLKASGCTACVGSGAEWRKCDGTEPGNFATNCKNSSQDHTHCDCDSLSCPGDEIAFLSVDTCKIDQGGASTGTCPRNYTKCTGKSGSKTCS